MSADTEHISADPSGEWMPRGIAFGSGGIRCLCQLGVYAALYDAGLTARVTDWYGCSGGAINAFFAALGVSSRWLRDCIGLLDLQIVGKVTEELVLDYMNTWGVNSGETLIEFLGRFANTWEPGSSTWTFADLARERPGTRLHIISTNISRGHTVTFNVTNTPDMRILDAVRASSAIPLFFTPWISAAGEVHCDGALLESYPWSCVTDKEQTLVILNSDTEIRQVREGHVREPPASLGGYMWQLFQTARRGYMISSTPPRHWIAVNNRVVSIVDFGITREQREALFAEGEAAGRGWIAFKRARHGATSQSPPACDGPNTGSSGHPSPDRMSGSRQSGNPAPPLRSSQGSQTPRSRDRRWSL
jgi:predicted acylesterase/phospholipase RssA